MGSGTAVAQQASDMVIVDDNFCTIVHAIQHGRAIYANIQKFVLFLLGTNIVQLLFILVCVAVGVPIPLSPLSVLFVNIATDGMCSVALSMEHGERELMTLPPRKLSEPILAGMRLVMLIGHSVALGIVLVVNYLLGLWSASLTSSARKRSNTGSLLADLCLMLLHCLLFVCRWFTGHFLASDLRLGLGGDGRGHNNCREFRGLTQWEDLTDAECRDGVARARTMVFLSLVFAEILRPYTVRNTLRGIWRGCFDNKSLLIGSALSLGLALVFTLTPGAHEIFSLTPTLPYYGWLLSVAGAVLVAVVDELLKSRFRTRETEKSRWRMMESNFSEIIAELRAATHKIHALELAVTMKKEDNQYRA